MALDLLQTTSQQRQEMIAERRKACEDFAEQIKSVKEKDDALTAENKEKIQNRDQILKNIKGIKRKGDALSILGILCLIACVILVWPVGGWIGILVGILVGLGGIAAIVFGIKIRLGWKVYKNDIDQANEGLTSYDNIHSSYLAEIKKMEEKIPVYNAEIAEIEDFERYAKYYKWAASVSKGHIVVFATNDKLGAESNPRSPSEGKKYKSAEMKSLEIFLDAAPKLEKTPDTYLHQSGALGVVALEESGAQKMHLRVNFDDANRGSDQITEPVSVKKSQATKFIWYHVSIAGKGTQDYTKTYNSFEKLREAINITKEEMMEILPD